MSGEHDAVKCVNLAVPKGERSNLPDRGSIESRSSIEIGIRQNFIQELSPSLFRIVATGAMLVDHMQGQV